MKRPMVCADVQIKSGGICGEINKYLLLRWLAALAGVLGTFFTFVTATDSFMLMNESLLALVTVLMWAVSCFVMSCDGKTARTAEAVLSVITAAAVLVTAKSVIKGGGEIAERFGSFVRGTGTEYPPMGADATVALCVTAALITVLVCFFSVRKPNLPMVVILTFPLPEVCLYFGLVPQWSAFAALMICYAAVGAAMFARNGGSSASAERAASQSAVSAAAFMLCAFLAGSLFSAAAGRSEWADKFRDRFLAYFSTFTIEKFNDDIQTAMFSSKNHELTHDGRLGASEEVTFDGSTMIEVTVPSDAPDIYLKGFTGTEYNGSRWSEGPPLPELETKITSPEFFAGRMIKYIPQYRDIETEYIAVRNAKTAPRAKYYPYNSAGLIESDGTRRKYWANLPRSGSWQKTVVENVQHITGLPPEMERDERAMREYAYANCLDVPASFTSAEHFFDEYDGSGVYDELSFIRRKLAQECDYTLESGKLPFGSDFADWFLTENHKGSCTHFASAAVLLARSRGIPARYCEGFIIKNSDLADGTVNGGYTTLSVPDSRAHAWAEIYLDGYGWMVFESTPGYGNVTLGDGEVSEGSELTEVTTSEPEFAEDLDPETTAPVSEEPPQTEPAQTIEIDAGTVFSDNAEVSTQMDMSETEHTESSTAAHQPPAKKPPVSEKLTGAIAVILLIVSAALLVFALRRSIYSKRRRKIERQPDTAAAEIYHMLLCIAKDEGVVIEQTDDTTAETLGKLFGRKEAAVITNAAVRARFAGGITADEAGNADRAFARIMEKYLENRKLKRVLRFILCKDRYAK